jgi:hypothetical protein
MYATIGTCPDIAYATNKLCSFNNNPDMAHWAAAKRVLQYLKGTKELGITYNRNTKNSGFHGYADATFASNHDLTSTSRNVFMLNGGAITWHSKKETTPTLSTADAEFTSMAKASKEIVWLRNLYNELGDEPKTATTLHGDNKSAIVIATNAQFHQRSKYFELHKLYLRDKIWNRQITLIYCPTNDMTADVLTKVSGTLMHSAYVRLEGECCTHIRKSVGQTYIYTSHTRPHAEYNLINRLHKL